MNKILLICMAVILVCGLSLSSGCGKGLNAPGSESGPGGPGDDDTQKGTEVENPPDEVILTFTSAKLGFSFKYEQGWIYTDYTITRDPPPESVYSDPIGTAKVLSYFQKGESNMVVLYDALHGTLSKEEMFKEYVLQRISKQDDLKMIDDFVDGKLWARVVQAEKSANGGAVYFLFYSNGDNVITLRGEFFGTAEELAEASDDFTKLADSFTFL